MNFIESSAGRIAARIQTIGAGFDPEVLALPGGSLIAAFIWIYASALTTLKRRPRHERPAPQEDSLVAPAPAPACAGCPGGRH